jgi:hypothetical protein
MAATARIAFHIDGDKPYQQHARKALPLLVRQAQSGEPITYGDLAEELGIPNPRNLNFVLGSIGRSLEGLSKKWKEKVPPIQCLVVRKASGLPGEGIGWFITNRNAFQRMSRSEKREVVKAELSKIFSYTSWRDVLKALSLPYLTPSLELMNATAAKYGGGEGRDHKRLKAYVAAHPAVIGLPVGTLHGKTEVQIPSGDSLDVSFRRRREWTAAEVKPIGAPDEDILRGIYQCIKYRATMEAVQAVEGRRRAVAVVLVLEGTLPAKLISVRNTLGITVFERVVPR